MKKKLPSEEGSPLQNDTENKHLILNGKLAFASELFRHKLDALGAVSVPCLRGNQPRNGLVLGKIIAEGILYGKQKFSVGIFYFITRFFAYSIIIKIFKISRP